MTAGGVNGARSPLSESAQALPFTVILLLLFSLLAFGVMGAGVAEGIRLRLQGAADAAALAAVGQAELWERLSVQRHRFACFATRHGWACDDSAAAPAMVSAPYTRLFPDGWMRDAGCQYGSDRQAGVPPRPDPATICDGWRLQRAGFSYPAGSGPQAAAGRYFAADTARLRAHGVPAVLTGVQVNGRTGAVQVSAAAGERANPLAILLRREVRVQVRAGARPHLAGPLRASGP